MDSVIIPLNKKLKVKIKPTVRNIFVDADMVVERDRRTKGAGSDSTESLAFAIEELFVVGNYFVLLGYSDFVVYDGKLVGRL